MEPVEPEIGLVCSDDDKQLKKESELVLLTGPIMYSENPLKQDLNTE